MKLFIFFSAIVAITLPAYAVSPVRVEVRQNVGTDSKGKEREVKTQKRSLTMQVQNNSKEQLDGLAVKYWFFAKDMKSNDVGVFRAGEKAASLKPGGRETIQSEEVSSTYNDDHVKLTQSGGKNSNQPRDTKASKVAAEGKKITGYAVRVYRGADVVAEFYSEPGFKEKVPAAAAAK